MKAQTKKWLTIIILTLIGVGALAWLDTVLKWEAFGLAVAAFVILTMILEPMFQKRGGQ